MSIAGWLIAHHVLAMLVGILSLAFAGSALRQRRPTGSSAAWLLVILLPWATLAANLLAQFFARTVGDSYLKVSALGNMFVCGAQVLALYQAMSSFDRSCSGRHMAHTERGELPDFMRST